MKVLFAASAALASYCLATLMFSALVSFDLTATDWANVWTYAALAACAVIVWAVWWVSVFVVVLAVSVWASRQSAARHAAFLRRGL